MTRRARDNELGGISAVEVLLLLVIAALVASAAVPRYLEARARARLTAITEAMTRIAGGAQAYYAAQRLARRRAPAAQRGKPWALLPASSEGYVPRMLHAVACRDHGGAFPAALNKQFDAAPFKQLGFKPSGRLRARYYFHVGNDGREPGRVTATIFAIADPACDARYHKWRLRLEAQPGARGLRRHAPQRLAP